MMYQGRNFDHVNSRLISGGGSDDRAGGDGLLFLGWRAPLCETLEAFEGVVDEYPVLVYYFAVLRHRRGRCKKTRMREMILVACLSSRMRPKSDSKEQGNLWVRMRVFACTHVFPVSRLEIRQSWMCRRWIALRPVSRPVSP